VSQVSNMFHIAATLLRAGAASPHSSVRLRTSLRAQRERDRIVREEVGAVAEAGKMPRLTALTSAAG